MTAAAIQIPSPQAFLDPLTEIENCYFYAVPRYSDLDHPNTRWLLAMLRNERLDKVKRKMELQPNIFRTSYFQLLDYPQLYNGKDPSATPLFHRQAVLYLTSIGVAIYLRSAAIVKLMLEYRDPSGDALYDIAEPQYATHVQDTVTGDFHSYPLAAVMMRSGFYDCVPDMLAAQWRPLLPICMPMRRRYERRALHFLDWLDYALFMLHDKPLLPLARLVNRLTNDDALYKYQRMPMEVVLPQSEDDRIPTGMIDVDKVPYESPMIGVKSLLQLAEDYGHYLELKDRHKAFKNCITQMRTDGVNPEIMMARAQDYDPYEDEQNEDASGNNANNNARSSSKSSRKGKKGAEELGPYASEPTRILLYAVQNDAKPSTKVATLLLLDAVAVYVKRNYYLVTPPPKKGKGDKQSPSEKKAKEQMLNLQMRDIRNSIVLLLNLLQQQFDKTDRLNKEQRGDNKRQSRFKHVDVAKQANNKRRILTLNTKRLNNLLFLVLLHSGELLDFLESTYPPYQYDTAVNFRLNPGLEHRLSGIQLEVMTEFNGCKLANSYLSLDALERAQGIKSLFLNLHVGRPPSQDASALASRNKNTGGRRNKAKNASNANSSADEQQHHQVSFVRVKRRLRPPKVAAKTAEAAEAAPAFTDDTGDATVAPDASLSVAATLSEQIQRLRQGGHGGADAVLAEIYNRIVEDLKLMAVASDGKAVGNGEQEQQQQQVPNDEQGQEAKEKPVLDDEEDEADSESSNNNRRRHVVARKAGGNCKRWRCRTRRRLVAPWPDEKGQRFYWQRKARYYSSSLTAQCNRAKARTEPEEGNSVTEKYANVAIIIAIIDVAIIIHH